MGKRKKEGGCHRDRDNRKEHEMDRGVEPVAEPLKHFVFKSLHLLPQLDKRFLKAIRPNGDSPFSSQLFFES